MQILGKLIFLIVAIALAVLVFYVSWFWRLLLVPMIVILVVDVLGSLFRKKS
ncbi:MAG: hypothetical protein Q8P25_02430 [Candidatus Curtissbacteria bacterium]|nr:hypothetical protein [Candidatus Curtissbacteria bacterium]